MACESDANGIVGQKSAFVTVDIVDGPTSRNQDMENTRNRLSNA
jgi:hypothetical protein